ncbi:MAG: MBL fold metallo-hydrolase [Victivallaceae bacterium]|nr:MBL fold metallo-hydrolase [Victivallaceae bacterium]
MIDRITILGSAAAEGIPAIFCNCRVCRQAWQNKGKDLRMRSAYKLNERVRVDFGPDSLAQEYRFDLHSENLRHLFITHSHEDHFYPELLHYRRKGFSVVPEESTLHLYGPQGVEEKITSMLQDRAMYQIEFHRVAPFNQLQIPEENLQVLALQASHMQGIEKALIYAFSTPQCSFLIGNDTGMFPEETFEALEKSRIKLDYAILDCTMGLGNNCSAHMSVQDVLKVVRRLRQNGSLSEQSRVVVNHFSHNGGAVHKELEDFFRPYNIQVGFDGMVVS